MTKEQQEKTEDKDDKKNSPGFLPPQSLPKPPPPPPIPEQDSSDLLSPWWSEENEAIPPSSNTPPSTSSPALPLDADAPDRILNLTLLSFGRKSKVEGDWSEKCFMLATTEAKQQKESPVVEDEEFEETVKKLTQESKECSMVCFLRESRRLTNERLKAENTSILTQLNPLYGTWVSVAKTPLKCKEHLETDYMIKKSEKDYYTLELGEELSHSGDYVKNAFSNTFGPLQRLGMRYVDSWKNGNQQAFFTRFWESAKRGDGIHLVTYSTKRLIESAIRHDKKSNNKDK